MDYHKTWWKDVIWVKEERHVLIYRQYKKDLDQRVDLGLILLKSILMYFLYIYFTIHKLSLDCAIPQRVACVMPMH